MNSLIVVLGILPLISGFSFANKKLINCNGQKTIRYTEERHNLNAGIFTNCEHVIDLNMQNNSIHELGNNVFLQMTKLKYLDLSMNNITLITNKSFSSLPKLEKIDLSENRIIILEENIFSNLPKLKFVYLQDNRITHIQKNCFENVPSLKLISLESNNLKTLQIDFIDNINNLDSLLLAGNPWNCDQNLCGLMNIAIDKFWGNMFFLPACHNVAPWNYILNYDVDLIPWNKYDIDIDANVDNIKMEVPDPVEIKCISCRNTTFSWQFEAYNNNLLKRKENITSRATQVFNKDYTVSTLIISGFSDRNVGNYTCYFGNSPTYEHSNWLTLKLNTRSIFPGIGNIHMPVPKYETTERVRVFVPLKFIIVGIGALISCFCYCCRLFCCSKKRIQETDSREPLAKDESA